MFTDSTGHTQEVVDKPSTTTVVLQEWYESPTLQVPISILVNGKSKISGNEIFDSSDYVEVNKYLRGIGANLKKKNNPYQTHPNAKYEVFKLARKNNPQPKQQAISYRFRILGLIG